jgi:hypothetical protein
LFPDAHSRFQLFSFQKKTDAEKTVHKILLFFLNQKLKPIKKFEPTALKRNKKKEAAPNDFLKKFHFKSCEIEQLLPSCCVFCDCLN